MVQTQEPGILASHLESVSAQRIVKTLTLGSRVNWLALDLGRLALDWESCGESRSLIGSLSRPKVLRLHPNPLWLEDRDPSPSLSSSELQGSVGTGFFHSRITKS